MKCASVQDSQEVKNSWIIPKASFLVVSGFSVTINIEKLLKVCVKKRFVLSVTVVRMDPRRSIPPFQEGVELVEKLDIFVIVESSRLEKTFIKSRHQYDLSSPASKAGHVP